MLKETETKEPSGFCHVFIIGGISIGGRAGPPGPPWLRLLRNCTYIAVNAQNFEQKDAQINQKLKVKNQRWGFEALFFLVGNRIFSSSMSEELKLYAQTWKCS